MTVHETDVFTAAMKSETCWCGKWLHIIPYGNPNWLQCTLHGSAYHERREEDRQMETIESDFPIHLPKQSYDH